MMRCQQCQPLILDYLYGLLEDADAAAVDEHLRDCAACAAARDESARMQGLIARAAKVAFPQVKFEAPAIRDAEQAKDAEGVAALPAVRTLAEPSQLIAPSSTNASSSRRATLLPWAIAAAVLLAVPGTVVPVLEAVDAANRAGSDTARAVADAEDAKNRVDREVAEVQQKKSEVAYKLSIAKQAEESLLAKWVDEEKKSIQTQIARKLIVDIHKPASIQPGAPNEFLLVLHDRGLAPNTHLIAEVRDQTDAVVFSQKLDCERKDNRHTIRLPAESWTKLTPQSELFLVVSSSDDKTDAKAELQEKVRLFGPAYTTMLVTDRTTYRPGEMLYFRSLTLDRITFQPPKREQFLHFELQGPHHRVIQQTTGGTDLVRLREGKVEPILGPDGKPLRGVGCGAFLLPNDLPDGDYTLALSESSHPPGSPPTLPMPVTRTVSVRAGLAEVYAKSIAFSAASFAAGESVEAWAEVKLQDRPVVDAEVLGALALADGEPIDDVASDARTGADGRARLKFTLPKNRELTDVRLKVSFKVGAIQESVARRVPAIGKKIVVEFFPEGGPLVAGVPCRVYFRATTPSGQPVDIRGTITDGRRQLAHLETHVDRDQPGANRGMGSFTFTPELGTLAWLKLDSPAGAFAPMLEGNFPVASAVSCGVPAALAARTGFTLPKPVADGVAMSVENPVLEASDKIRVRLQSAGKPRTLTVGAYTRGRLSDSKRIETQPGQPALVELMPSADGRGGVVRITAFEESSEHAEALGGAKAEFKPIAERLVYRKPNESLQLACTATGRNVGAGFAPNSTVDLTLKATDEKGKPTAAVLWAAAVNSGAETGRGDRLLTTHFLLAGEVKAPDAMEDADFLLSDSPKAAAALDTVLATQGWRRFVEQTPVGFALHSNAANPDQSRLLANNGQYPTQAETPGMRERRKLYEMYWPRYEQAVKALAAARAESDAMNADRGERQHILDLQRAAHRALRETISSIEDAKPAVDSAKRIHDIGRYGMVGFGLLGAIMLGLAVMRPLSRLPYGVGTAGALGLVAFLAAIVGTTERIQAGFRSNVGAVLSERERLDSADASTGEEHLESAAAAPEAETLSSSSRPLPVDAMKRSSAVPPASPLGSSFGSSESKAEPGSAGGFMPAPKNPPSAPSPFAIVPPRSASDGQTPGPADANRSSPPGLGGAAMRTAEGNGPGPALPKASFLAMRAILDSELVPGRDNSMRPPTAKLAERADSFARELAIGRSFEKATEYRNELGRVLVSGIERQNRKEEDDKKNKPLVMQGAKRMVESNQPPEILALKLVKAAIPTSPPLVVREYAALRPGSEKEDWDYSDTILWQPAIVVPGDGEAKLSVQLGSARGGYRVIVAGHTLDGRIGSVRGIISIAPVSPQDSSLTPVPVGPIIR